LVCRSFSESTYPRSSHTLATPRKTNRKTKLCTQDDSYARRLPAHTAPQIYQQSRLLLLIVAAASRAGCRRGHRDHAGPRRLHACPPHKLKFKTILRNNQINSKQFKTIRNAPAPLRRLRRAVDRGSAAAPQAAPASAPPDTHPPLWGCPAC
jgi:hypothetical protein